MRYEGYYSNRESGSPWERACARERKRNPRGFGVKRLGGRGWLTCGQLKKRNPGREDDRAIFPDAYTAQVHAKLAGVDMATHVVCAVFD